MRRVFAQPSRVDGGRDRAVGDPAGGAAGAVPPVVAADVATDLAVGAAGRDARWSAWRGVRDDGVAAAGAGVGDEVRLGGQVQAVTALADGRGAGCWTSLAPGGDAASPAADRSHVHAGRRRRPRRRCRRPACWTGCLPRWSERARWWERHVIEVLTGLPPGRRAERPAPARSTTRRHARCGSGSWPRSAELAARVSRSVSGRCSGCGAATSGGLRGPGRSPGPRLSRRPAGPTSGWSRRRAGDRRGDGPVDRHGDAAAAPHAQILAADGIEPDAPPMPAGATFYRLAARSAGQHTFGSARTRRSRGQGARTAVRDGDRGPAGRVDADRLHAAGRAGGAGQRR